MLQYFSNVKHNSVVQDSFCQGCEDDQNLTEQWDGKLAWYSPSDIHWFCLYGWEKDFGIHRFKPTWLCLIGSCNVSKIFGTSWLLYSDQVHIHLSHDKCF